MFAGHSLKLVAFAVIYLGLGYVITAQEKPVTEACLTCICETLSGCNSTAICVNGACGIFRITFGYWAEAGKLTINDEPSLSKTAFTNCVNDPYCAADTIQGYMTKFGQDCDNNEKIDCYDYSRLHRLGSLNCTATLPFNYGNTFKKCIKRFERAERANAGAN